MIDSTIRPMDPWRQLKITLNTFYSGHLGTNQSVLVRGVASVSKRRSLGFKGGEVEGGGGGKVQVMYIGLSSGMYPSVFNTEVSSFIGIESNDY